MKKNLLMLLTISLLAILISCGEDEKNPIEPNKNANIITTVPKSAFIGDTITIIGANFGESLGTGFVSFAGIIATDYTSWSENEIVVKVPEGAESGKLWLEVGGEKSNEVDFNVLIIKKATITSINPQSIFINDTLTITGKYFGDSSKTNYITFSYMNIYNYISWSDTEIKVKVYTGIRSGKLWLNINGEMSNKVDYTILFKIPNIISVIPQSAAIGDTVIITGTNFGESKGFSFVSFASTSSINHISWNENEIKVKVPKDAMSGKIWVEVESVKSNELDFTVFGNFMEYGTVKDIDGQVYKTVKIGNQWWMAENLNVSRYRNGDPIRHAESKEDWVDAGNKNEGAWCYYNNDPANGEIYGKLYNWYAVDDSRGLAPEGYHVATEPEWTILENYLGGSGKAGAKLKEAGINHWNNPNSKSTNSSGFTAFPGGQRIESDDFSGLRDFGNWWSETEHNGTNVWSRHLNYYTTYLFRYYNSKVNGYSVRCITD